MIHTSSLIEMVSRYLRDQEEDYEYTRWTESELLSYLQLAVDFVSIAKPTLFTKRVNISLVQGAVQTVPDTCNEFGAVIGQVSSDGTISPVRRVSSKLALTLNIPLCSSSSDGEYVASSWRYDDEDSRTLYVDPPVPFGYSGTMTISCYNPPVIASANENINLPSNWRTAIFELMLYYAYGVDIESIPQRDRAAVHWNNAITIMRSLGVDITTKKRQSAQQIAGA